MQISAKLQNLRISPRKVRLVVDLIRGKKLKDAQTILSFTTKSASRSILKLLKQAEANAKNNFQLDPSNLFISKITVNEGSKLKRWRPRARGQTYQIQKKTSHITVCLEEIKKTAKKIKKIKPEAAKKEIVSPVEEGTREKKIVTAKKAKFEPKTEIQKPKTSEKIKRIFRRDIF